MAIKAETSIHQEPVTNNMDRIPASSATQSRNRRSYLFTTGSASSIAVIVDSSPRMSSCLYRSSPSTLFLKYFRSYKRLLRMLDGLNFKEFIAFLSPFSSFTTVRQKIEFMFKVCDLECNRKVGFNNVMSVLRNLTGSFMTE